MRLYTGLFLLSILYCLPLGAQNLEEKKEQAKQLFYKGKYRSALSLLKFERQPDHEALFIMALSNYHLNRLQASEEQLREILEESKAPYPETILYLARIFHSRHEFDRAMQHYKQYLKAIDPNHRNRGMVRDAVRRCANGRQIQYRQPLGVVENLGPQLNTEYDEYGPVLSPNRPDRLYFTSARLGSIGGPRDPSGRPDEVLGHYSADIYRADKHNGKWDNVQGLHYYINSPKHEVLLDFDQEGKSMIYYKGSRLENGSVYVDTFSRKQTLSSRPFNGPIDPLAGVTAPHFLGDTMVIFSSRRPGGYGGLDLYRSMLRYGSWTAPENLGPNINSAYDETTPFLANDNHTLYFSSNRKDGSLGGFDIFKSVYIDQQGAWTTPYNLGMPFNSAGDDTHFRLARDGYTGYFSSSRKDGLGERDLYAGYFFDYLPEMARSRNTPQRRERRVEATPQPRPASTALPKQLPGIAFNSDAEVFLPKYRPLLESIRDMMLKDPDLHLLITAYSLRELATSSRLFSAIKSAENLLYYLRDEGINIERISLIGMSAEGNSARKLEFRLLTQKGELVQDAQNSLATEHDYLGLLFKVEIASSRQIYRGDLLNQYEAPMVEKRATDPAYYYAVGYCSSVEAARELASQLGRNTAQIVPYLNGKRVRTEDVPALQDDYPELLAW